MNEKARDLDERTQKMLSTILRKEEHELTKEDKAALLGRREYLTTDTKERYSKVFAAPKKKEGKGKK